MATASQEMACNTAHSSWGPKFEGDEVVFRLWAPDENGIRLRLAGNEVAMTATGKGWFEHRCSLSAAGHPYQFVLSDGLAVPDPASRAQVKTADGPSRLVAPDSYHWKNIGWRGRPWEEAVICELHIGTFTNEGTFRAAMEKLPHLAESGFTAIEIMPVAQFSGERGWGYDGVLHYAPHTAYGTPGDMKTFIDAAHAHGLMVLLDVVYNHFGPEGNYLPRYAPAFFRSDRQTPWGAAIDFGQAAVRRYFIDNALYWIGEFRLDGLRLDAVEQIYDTSPKHILTEIAESVRSAFRDRHVHLVVEDQRNATALLMRGDDERVELYTAEWNDDFHHVVHVIATGEKSGHYKDFSAAPWAKLARTLEQGFVFPNRHDGKVAEEEGDSPAAVELHPTSFINFLQNHDQIGNRAFGERLPNLTDAGMLKLMTAILLLSPQIPLLFMGEEFGETQPYFFFCDYRGQLAEIVRKGRIAEAENFGGMKKGKSLADLPDPNARTTFENSKLRWQTLGAEQGRQWLAFVRNLVQLRRRHIVPLLKHGKIEAKVQAARDGVIAVDWTLGTHKLELRANLSEEAKSVPPFDGAPIYYSRPEAGDIELADGKLAGRSLVSAIDPALAGRGEDTIGSRYIR